MEDVIEVEHTSKDLANNDGNEHTHEFVVNGNTHVTTYKFQEGRFAYDHKLDGESLIEKYEVDEDDFEAILLL